MTDHLDDRVSTLLTAWFASRADHPRPSGLLDATMDRIERTRPLPPWLVLDRWTRQPASVVQPRLGWVLIVVAMVIVSVVVVATAGRTRLPAPFGIAVPGRLAYVADGDLWTAEADGSAVERLTDDPRVDMSPVWSPDGTKVAFRRLPVEGTEDDWSNQGDILVVDAVTGSIRLVDARTRTPSPVTWAPDGRSIAYSKVVDGLDQVVVAALDGSSPQAITHGDLAAFAPVWSPDPTIVAFVVGSDVAQNVQHEPMTVDGIWIVRTNAGALKLTQRPMTHFNVAGWSPDGTTLYYAFGPPEDRGIWRVGLDGAPEEFVTDGFDPAVSPDGTRLAFLRPGDGYVSRIWVSDADGSSPHPISVEGAWRGPRWSPDGRQVVVTDDRLFDAPAIVVLDPRVVDTPITFDLPERVGVGRADAPSWQRLAQP
jgi:Tol biopolymer transport system component